MGANTTMKPAMSATHMVFDMPAPLKADSGFIAASTRAHTATPTHVNATRKKMKNTVHAQLSRISVSRTLEGEHRVPQCRSRTDATPHTSGVAPWITPRRGAAHLSFRNMEHTREWDVTVGCRIESVTDLESFPATLRAALAAEPHIS